MKQIIIAFTAIGLIAGYNLQAADDQTSRQRADRANDGGKIEEEIDHQIDKINKMDDHGWALRAGIVAVSKETAVPLSKIESEHEKHLKVGVAGLFVALELSARSTKPMETFIQQHADGKSWTELVQAGGEDLGAVRSKLTRIEQAMRDSNTATASVPDRTLIRESDTKSSLDRRVQALNTFDKASPLSRQGLSAVSKETSVSLTMLEETQKQNPGTGLGDLFIAQELAKEKQKPASEFLKLHTSGKSWNEIVTAQNQSVADIEKKLERVERATRAK